MAEKLIKIRITRGVIVDGKPAKVGDVLSVNYETAMVLKHASELYAGSHASTPEPEAVTNDDPESESRDPKPFRKR